MAELEQIIDDENSETLQEYLKYKHKLEKNNGKKTQYYYLKIKS